MTSGLNRSVCEKILVFPQKVKESVLLCKRAVKALPKCFFTVTGRKNKNICNNKKRNLGKNSQAHCCQMSQVLQSLLSQALVSRGSHTNHTDTKVYLINAFIPLFHNHIRVAVLCVSYTNTTWIPVKWKETINGD